VRVKNGPLPLTTRGTATAEGPCDTLVSRNSATTVQNIPFENYSPGPIVWHYLGDPTFSRFHKIPQTERRTE